MLFKIGTDAYNDDQIVAVRRETKLPMADGIYEIRFEITFSNGMILTVTKSQAESITRMDLS